MEAQLRRPRCGSPVRGGFVCFQFCLAVGGFDQGFAGGAPEDENYNILY